MVAVNLKVKLFNEVKAVKNKGKNKKSLSDIIESAWEDQKKYKKLMEGVQ